MKLLRGVFFLLVSLMSGGLGFAADVPPLTGVFNDPYAVVSAQRREEITAFLKGREAKSSNQIVVLVVKTLDGDTVENFADRVFREWKLGQAGKDNGVLLVVASQDHKARIEVGRGLQGPLPDQRASRILEEKAVPNFEKRLFGTGILQTVKAIDAAVDGEFTAEPKPKAEGDAAFFMGVAFAVVFGGFFLAFLIFIVLPSYRVKKPAPVERPVYVPSGGRGRSARARSGDLPRRRSQDDDHVPVFIPVSEPSSRPSRSSSDDSSGSSSPSPEPAYVGGGGSNDGGGASASWGDSSSGSSDSGSSSGGGDSGGGGGGGDSGGGGGGGGGGGSD